MTPDSSYHLNLWPFQRPLVTHPLLCSTSLYNRFMSFHSLGPFLLTLINILWLLLQVVGLDSRTELAVLAYNVIVLGFPSSGRLHCFKVNYDGKKSRDNIGQHKFICQKFKRSIVAQYQCNIKLASKKMLKGLAIIAVFLDR